MKQYITTNRSDIGRQSRTECAGRTYALEKCLHLFKSILQAGDIAAHVGRLSQIKTDDLTRTHAFGGPLGLEVSLRGVNESNKTQ